MTRILRLACTLLLAVVLLGALPVTAPANAASTYLCTGYDSCASKGYSHAGYKANAKKMWWRMYSGHNCTNYAAYRMVKAGMSTSRPWSGSGNATNWGRAMKNITDKTPMVGAVAWWAAGDGVGSAGHVAYVEQVVSATQIVISEDSWGGDFHWRRINKSSSSWPTGFVHFRDRAVTNTSAPVIYGTPAVGEPLTAGTGGWTPAGTYSFQWYADGKAIDGATTSAYTPPVAMLGKALSVRVVATRLGYRSGSSTSLSTVPVAPGTMDTGTVPAVTGTVRVDESLVLRPGSWSPRPTSTTVQWYADGKAIAGATTRSLHLGQDLFRQKITVRMTAKLKGYRTSAVTSASTRPVEAGLIDVTQPFTMKGLPRLGQILTGTPGTVDPVDSEVTYAWLRNGSPIAGATGLRYKLTAADVGSRVSFRATLRHRGYLDRAETLTTAGVVTTVPSLKVTANGKRRRAVVHVRVTAPGIAAPTGRVTVTVAGHEMTGRLVDGRLTVVVEDVKPGTRTVKVAYDGTGAILPGRARSTVQVLP